MKKDKDPARSVRDEIDALRQSEERFKYLFEYAPTPYHTLAPDGAITDVNQKWCQALGYKKEHVLGKKIFDFIVREEREEAGTDRRDPHLTARKVPDSPADGETAHDSKASAAREPRARDWRRNREPGVGTRAW